MRKETVFAILTGILIGLLVAFGIWRLVIAVKKTTKDVVTTIKNIPPKKELNLNTTNLKDFQVLTEEKFKIEGFTKPKSHIIISTTDNDYYVVSLEDGSFETEIELISGISEIKVINIDANESQRFIVTFSGEFAEYVEKNPDAKTTSYVGTITDISKGTIQIKAKNGEILQASTQDDTSYVNTVGKVAEVKESDLAIGDYAVILGFINGNKVLQGKRVLITKPVEENKTEVKKITIEKLTKTVINDITLPKKWVGPNVKELEVGDEIIVVGITTDNKFDLRSIFIPVQ